MGLLLDYLTGGNAKVAAHSVAKYHVQFHGNYETVYLNVFMMICHSISTAKNPEALTMFENNQIKNYSELACVQLNVLAAPSGTSVYQTISDLKSRIAQYLLNKGLPQQYILGDNRELTIGLLGKNDE